MEKILIVDFDDSFTFNIAELCHRWSLEFEVLNYKELDASVIHKNNYKNIIWGPGPGRPSSYPEVGKLINSLFKEDLFHFGICLGHQLIFEALGYEIVDAPVKRHGRSGMFSIPRWPSFSKADWGREMEVQYYSSLAVKDSPVCDEIEKVVDGGVILSGNGVNFLSYQFHPESVGTSCPEVFFRRLREKLI